MSSSDTTPPVSPYDALGELRCPVTVLLGTGTITVRQCLALRPHAVLRLDQTVGQDLRIVVTGVAIASGEVAVVDATTAVRVTELAAAAKGGQP